MYAYDVQTPLAATDAEENYLELKHVTNLSRWTISNQKNVKEEAQKLKSIAAQPNAIYPNPVRPHQKTFAMGMGAGMYTLIMFDAVGQQVYRTSFEVQGGTQSGTFTVSELPTGNYYYTLQADNQPTIIYNFLAIKPVQLLQPQVIPQIDTALQELDVEKAKSLCESNPGPLTNIIQAGLARTDTSNYDSEQMREAMEEASAEELSGPFVQRGHHGPSTAFMGQSGPRKPIPLARVAPIL